MMSSESFVVPKTFRISATEQPSSLIMVFARSQTEMAGSRDAARSRLVDLTTRLGRDQPQIVTQMDDTLPGEVGTYVVNREGMPVAVEIFASPR